MDQLISTSNVQVLNQDSVSVKTSAKTSLFKRFISWCDAQNANKFLWLGISLFGNIGAMLPITLFAIYLAGNDFNLWIVALCANVPVLALNLAAQPPKVTLPTLLIASFVNLSLIIYGLLVFSLR
jgi:hypothetical protein